MTAFVSDFKQQSIFRINESLERVKNCLDRLSEAEIWKRPNDSSNSVGNLVLHLCGNIRQYAISSISGSEDIRDRPEEFAVIGGFERTELIELLEQTVNEATNVIDNLPEQEYLRVRRVQGYELSGMGIVIHVTEHFSYHTGQIAFWTKQLKDEDLGFYADKDLNVKNEN